MNKSICLKTTNIKLYGNIINKIHTVYMIPLNMVRRHIFYDYSFKPMARFMKEKYKDKPLVGCEIGVLNGDHAFCIVKNLNIKELYLIDPYFQYGYYSDPEDNLKQAKKRLKDYNSCIFIRKKSSEAKYNVPNNLDFVYIDGNHDYKFVKEDIDNYWDKIKPGGIIGGHDYRIDYQGVVKAVDEFKNKNGFELFGKESDWWIIKRQNIC